jgi:hypothetical protein
MRTYKDIKETPWFETSTPPVRPGVYKFRNKESGSEFFMYFSNGRYYRPGTVPNDAQYNYNIGSLSVITYRTHNNHLQWRGVEK